MKHKIAAQASNGNIYLTESPITSVKIGQVTLTNPYLLSITHLDYQWGKPNPGAKPKYIFDTMRHVLENIPRVEKNYTPMGKSVTLYNPISVIELPE